VQLVLRECSRIGVVGVRAGGIERLLLRPELCSEAGQVFLDRYGELIDLSASGELRFQPNRTVPLVRRPSHDALMFGEGRHGELLLVHAEGVIV